MIDNEKLDQLLLSALREDIGEGDHSTLGSIDASAKGKATLKIKQTGILAGVYVAERVFGLMQPDIIFTGFKKDGEPMLPGETAFDVSARVHTILQCERLVLNCMQRMSGISTLTTRYTEKLKGYNTKLLDTRKTTPNFRLLEKEAVRIGGGFNHRFGLFDMVMLKDNHVDYCGGILKAITRMNEYLQTHELDLKIEIETRTLDEVRTVMAAGNVHRIMLDNFSPKMVAEAMQIIDGAFETEASGGINLENIEQYAATGVTYISSGAIIHQATSLDLSLKAMTL